MFSEIKSIQTEIDKLHAAVLSLVLSTTSANGQLHTSYAPYLYEGGNYYIPVSGLTPLSQHMKSCPLISLMIIEDEQQAKSICGRTRLSCQAKTETVDRNSAEFIYIIDQLRQRVGKTMDLFVALTDFKLFRMSPQNGSLMMGLSKAYELYHIEANEKNHLSQLQIA